MKIITPLPVECYLACSGGVDSMVFYHFLKQSDRKITCLFFNHGTDASRDAQSFLEKNIPQVIKLRFNPNANRNKNKTHTQALVSFLLQLIKLFKFIVFIFQFDTTNFRDWLKYK